MRSRTGGCPARGVDLEGVLFEPPLHGRGEGVVAEGAGAVGVPEHGLGQVVGRGDYVALFRREHIVCRDRGLGAGVGEAKGRRGGEERDITRAGGGALQACLRLLRSEGRGHGQCGAQRGHKGQYCESSH